MLNIPSRTKRLLEQDAACHSFALACTSNVRVWLTDNKTPFFPEYTDHGFTHLNEVLLTADSIISDESWAHLTPQDAAAMIVSVLLHDCAMHLTEDGFYTIIRNKVPKVVSRYVGEEASWDELWYQFFQEAKRFDAKKLYSIFGDEIPVKKIPENKLDLTGRDRLLIGEFIRRHHARIAHEIAFYGIPGVEGEFIKLAEEPTANFLDLCGFIARSHNLSLRAAVDKLEKNKKQVHLNTHAPFLMLVLRIADYIQIHSERAPKQLLMLKGLTSPVSKREWKKHNSIIEINQAHEDPEALYIDAEPTDALTHRELKKLFLDIQSELDLSWSVLGEVYGRYEHLKELGITIRRIRSSLDDINQFVLQKKPQYIPKILGFRTADSEMIELLIAPLYGDNPEVGIRELTQNSVDACSELKDIQIKNNIKPKEEPSFDVCVTLIDDGESGGSIIIEDYGVGMTLDIVENYFLNIGASFRNSDRWKKDHETDGHSNVYRTGRFGIGLLAAYLLGNELLVETRHFSESETKALSFRCEKGSDKIVIRHTRFHVGTRITIKLSDETKKYLLDNEKQWDWFCLSSPRVIRKVLRNGKEDILEQGRTVPGPDSDIEDSGWYRTIAENFDDVLWTYKKFERRRFDHEGYYWGGATLICNGIVITDHLNLDRFNISKKIGLIEPETPSLNVFDQDGRLPINLQRSALVTKQLPFIEQLAKDVSKYIANNLAEFCRSLGSAEIKKDLLYEISNMSISGLGENYSMDGTCKMMITKSGFVPIDYDLLAITKPSTICIDGANLSKNKGSWKSGEFVKYCDNYILVNGITDTKNSRSGFVRGYFELNSYSRKFSSLPIRGRRILIKKTDVLDIVSPGYVPRTFWNRLKSEWQNKSWLLVSVGDVPEIAWNMEKLCQELDQSQSFGFITYYLNWDGYAKEEEESIFAQAWLEQNSQLAFI